MSKTLVLFDFDETIIKENSIQKLLYAASGRRFLWPLALGVLAHPSGWGQLRQAVKNQVYNRCLFSITDSRQYNFGQAFGITFTLNSEVCRRMWRHHEQGHRIWVVTASPQSYIEGVIKSLGLPCELVIGTRLSSPCTSFNLCEIECSGEKKVYEVRKLLSTRSLHFDTVVAYGNLPFDREMLSMADVGYVITDGKTSKYVRD
ncbi:HAD family hydrolase [Endozoicomonas ascidiicola]|uniref:HAD family hydrolase n=1 Tax=Endozoicomonas ascidiicola TaxID=1698521 RepID=UPI00083705D4|nr:HAD family hydrolase [Endozoicomonas ascidiicola]USN27013.1 haloacid dehalogenase-like hydrolase [synthetic construct]